MRKHQSYIQKVHFVNGDDTLNLICGVVYEMEMLEDNTTTWTRRKKYNKTIYIKKKWRKI